MFYATSYLLKGDPIRPDILTTIEWEEKYSESAFVLGEGHQVTAVRTMQGCNTSSTGSVNTDFFNEGGCIPVVSTATGAFRMLLGTIHTIVHLVASIFDAKNRHRHLNEAWHGTKHVLRGTAEIIPIIGNIISAVVDIVREKRYEKQANEHFKTFNKNHLELGKKYFFEYECGVFKRLRMEITLKEENNGPTTEEVEDDVDDIDPHSSPNSTAQLTDGGPTIEEVEDDVDDTDPHTSPNSTAQLTNDDKPKIEEID